MPDHKQRGQEDRGLPKRSINYQALEAKAVYQGLERQGTVEVPYGGIIMHAELCVPEESKAAVVVAEGSSNSTSNQRSREIVRDLNDHHLATLLPNMLNPEEDEDSSMRFDLGLLSDRLLGCIEWIRRREDIGNLPIVLLGAGTGSAVALRVASMPPAEIAAVACRDGDIELAGELLEKVGCPTLLLIGDLDRDRMDSAHQAFLKLGSEEKELRLLPGAGRLFDEPGAIEQVARLAAGWFREHASSARD